MEKHSDELFTVDTCGSEHILKSYNRVYKPLKADQILAQRSILPAVDNRKRPETIQAVAELNSKRRKGNGVSYKEFDRLRSIAYGGEKAPKDIVKADGVSSYDPWAVASEVAQDPRFDYLDRPQPIKAPKTLKEAPISLVEGVPHFPAVPKPQAGKSYNPMFEDWDKLLVEEGAKEVKAERKRLREAEEERIRLERVAAAHEEEEDIQTEDESAWEGFGSEYEQDHTLKKRRPGRKTPTERNRAKRRKEAERQEKWEAEMKRRARQAARIREIAREVEVRGKLKADAVTEKDRVTSKADENASLRRRKLGKSTYAVLPPFHAP